MFRKITFLSFILCWFGFYWSAVAKSNDDTKKWLLQIDLIDGSRVIGAPSDNTLQIDVGFIELKIPIRRIRVIDWSNGPEKVRVEMKNNDVYTGSVKPFAFQLKTIFGNATIETKFVRRITTRPSNQLAWLPNKQGLVLSYTFDRVGDGVVLNQASDRHTGKLIGGTWTNQGQRGGAISFQGKKPIEVAHHQELCPQKLTLATWIKPQRDQSSYRVIVAKTSASSWHGGYGLVRMPGTPKHIHFFVNGYTHSVAKMEVPNNTWSHVVGVCDGQHVKVYLNGKEVESKKMRPTNRAVPVEIPVSPIEPESLFSHPAVQNSIQHTNAPLFIGSDARNYAWNGMIDDLLLYNRALSKSEIEELYQATAMSR